MVCVAPHNWPTLSRRETGAHLFSQRHGSDALAGNMHLMQPFRVLGV